MKTWTGDIGRVEAIHNPLKRKNYNDLILTDVFAPRILVLVILPVNIEEWVTLSPEQFVLRRCGYWLSLAGQPQTDNKNLCHCIGAAGEPALSGGIAGDDASD